MRFFFFVGGGGVGGLSGSQVFRPSGFTFYTFQRCMILEVRGSYPKYGSTLLPPLEKVRDLQA